MLVAQRVSRAPVVSADWQGENVDVTAIERQLTSLWAEIGSEHEFSAPVRTSIFNLVVYTAREEDAIRIIRSLEELPGRQPSRVIILVADRLSDRCSVDARVSVRCRSSGAGDSRVCHERLVVTARNRAADHLTSVVIPLLLPDIPTYLWWPGQPPFTHRAFHRLLSIADQLVVDSAQFSSPGDGFAHISGLRTRKQGVNDFHWARLTPWREILAQFFDGPAWLPYAHSIVSMQLTFGDGADTTSATAGSLLLLGWAGMHLGWKPETTLDTSPTQDVTLSAMRGEKVIPIELRFRPHGEAAAGRLVSIELVSQPKDLPPARFAVQRLDDMEHATVQMSIHGGQEISRLVPLALKSTVELLANELDLAGHDHLYDAVVEAASQMAGREMWQPV